MSAHPPANVVIGSGSTIAARLPQVTVGTSPSAYCVYSPRISSVPRHGTDHRVTLLAHNEVFRSLGRYSVAGLSTLFSSGRCCRRSDSVSTTSSCVADTVMVRCHAPSPLAFFPLLCSTSLAASCP